MNKKKILLIENRRAVFFYDKISKYLLKDYEIHWIIQNNFFIPKTGIKHLIKYPKKNNLKKINSKIFFKKIHYCDRGRIHFHNKSDHYYYYYKEIKKIITKIKPSSIIGETTFFHEQIAVQIAKKLKIRYIFPTATRYPNNRAVFLKYDTLEPLTNRNKNNHVGIKDLKILIKNTANNKYKLFYMGSASIIDRIKTLAFQFYTTLAYFFGERYNTPGPLKFIKLYLQKKIVRYLWIINTLKIKKKLSSLLKNNKVILYPMQYQPEVNIDVWGYPHNNQTKIIVNLSKTLKKIDYFLAVKINPKFKYELDYESFIKIKKLSNVILIPPKIDMKFLLNNCLAIFSITGTVIIECILFNKNIFTISNSFFSSYDGVIKVKSYSHLIKKLKIIENKKMKKNLKNKISLFKNIYKNSYPYPFNLFNWYKKYPKANFLMAKSITEIEKNEKF